MAPADEMKRYANDLWQQAIDQIDEARDSLLKSRDRFEADMHRVRQERDRLLIKLGEQTLKLTRQDQLKLPKAVQQTIDRLNQLLDELIDRPRRRQKPKTKAAAAPVAKQAAAKPAKKAAPKAAKKATKKVAKKAAKKTAKKATKKTAKKAAGRSKANRKTAAPKKRPAASRKTKKAGDEEVTIDRHRKSRRKTLCILRPSMGARGQRAPPLLPRRCRSWSAIHIDVVASQHHQCT